jgi:hypothetical protein
MLQAAVYDGCTLDAFTLGELSSGLLRSRKNLENVVERPKRGGMAAAGRAHALNRCGL